MIEEAEVARRREVAEMEAELRVRVGEQRGRALGGPPTSRRTTLATTAPTTAAGAACRARARLANLD